MKAVTMQSEESFDVVVVGGSFAGLSFAGAAASRGLRVLLLEKDGKPGLHVRTTGILFSDLLNILDIPSHLLLNSVRRIHLQPPDQAPITIASQAYRYFMADVRGLLGWMARQAEERGANLYFGASFQDARRAESGLMTITYRSVLKNDLARSAEHGTLCSVNCRFLVGADGANSLVAQRVGLDRNRRTLVGLEWQFEGVQLDGETFYAFLDHNLAPGYCVWLAPNGQTAAIGVAGYTHTINPRDSLNQAMSLFPQYPGLKGARILEQRSGVIPIGGRLRRVYRNDGRARALLIGDAAGLCGAATGGGIYPAVLSGRLAGHAVTHAVLNESGDPVELYVHNLMKAGGLGNYLRVENWIRRVLDGFKTNTDVANFYSALATEDGRRALRTALLETPLCGMDIRFAATVRQLVSYHQLLYHGLSHVLASRFNTTRRSHLPHKL